MRLKSLIQSVLFPSNCPICGGLSENSDSPCGECVGRFRLECAEVCPDCGKSASFCRCGCGFLSVTKTELAGVPFAALAFYHSVRSFGDPGERLTERMIFRFKRSGEFADFFADELSGILRSRLMRAGEDPSDWRITYPPRSRRKRASLGFDQSAEAAMRIGANLGIPAETVFERTADAGEQKRLNAEERTRQAESSLLPIREKIVPGAKYILFDDIITSGATVETAARLLYFCGAAAVYPAAVARTYGFFTGAGQTPVSQSKI